MWEFIYSKYIEALSEAVVSWQNQEGSEHAEAISEPVSDQI